MKVIGRASYCPWLVLSPVSIIIIDHPFSYHPVPLPCKEKERQPSVQRGKRLNVCLAVCIGGEIVKR